LFDLLCGRNERHNRPARFTIALQESPLPLSLEGLNASRYHHRRCRHCRPPVSHSQRGFRRLRRHIDVCGGRDALLWKLFGRVERNYGRALFVSHDVAIKRIYWMERRVCLDIIVKLDCFILFEIASDDWLDSLINC